MSDRSAPEPALPSSRRCAARLLVPRAGAPHRATAAAPGPSRQRQCQGLAQVRHEAGEISAAGEPPAHRRRCQEKQEQGSARLYQKNLFHHSSLDSRLRPSAAWNGSCALPGHPFRARGQAGWHLLGTAPSGGLGDLRRRGHLERLGGLSHVVLHVLDKFGVRLGQGGDPLVGLELGRA